MMLRFVVWQPRVIQLENKKFKGNPRVQKLCTELPLYVSSIWQVGEFALDRFRWPKRFLCCGLPIKLQFEKCFSTKSEDESGCASIVVKVFWPLHSQLALGFKLFNDVTNYEELLLLLLSITLFNGIEIRKNKTLLPMNLVSILNGKLQGRNTINQPSSLPWTVKNSLNFKRNR